MPDHHTRRIPVPSTDRLRRPLILLLAGGSLAVGVPAALAAGGGGDAPAGPTTTTPVQQEQQDRQERPGDDCPEHEGEGGDGGVSSASGTGAPDPAV